MIGIKKMSKIRKLAIIGNGFDLHHGIKSSYTDFYKSSFLSDDIKSLYENMTAQLREANSWFDFEEEYRKLIKLEYDILGNEGYDRKTLGASDENLKIYRPRIDLINYVFQSIFQQFIQYLQLKVQELKGNRFWKKDSCVQIFINQIDQVLNFNYTSTLSEIYDVPENKIVFVHGSLLKHNSILGHSNYYDSIVPQNYGFHAISPGVRELALLGDKNLQRIEMWNNFAFHAGSFYKEEKFNSSLIEKMKFVQNNSPLSLNTTQYNFDHPFLPLKDEKNNQKFHNELALDFSENLEVYVIGRGLKSDFDLLSKIPVTIKKVTILKRSSDLGKELRNTAKAIFKTNNIEMKNYDWD